MPEDVCRRSRIPDKFYFKIGEVSAIVGVPAYVLRFWEKEFKQVKPKRTDAGQRMYRRQDVALLLKIKQLLHDRKFTIQGARQHLKKKAGRARSALSSSPFTEISEIRNELIRIRDLIDASRQ